MVKGFPDMKDLEGKCDDFLVGKKHKDNIPKQAIWRNSKKLELIHFDICGPITPLSNAGNKYFITFTDDYIRKTWIYLLQEKSRALDAFKRFKSLVENESGYLI